MIDPFQFLSRNLQVIGQFSIPEAERFVVIFTLSQSAALLSELVSISFADFSNVQSLSFMFEFGLFVLQCRL